MHFDKHLAHIAPYNPAGFKFMPADNTLYSLYLHLTHGFQWDMKVVGEEDLGFGETEGILPTIWRSEFDDDV